MNEWNMGTCTRCMANDYVIQMHGHLKFFCLTCFDISGDEARKYTPPKLNPERMSRVLSGRD